MSFIVGSGRICGLLLALVVEVKEQDSNKLWNHLLLSSETPAVDCSSETNTNSLTVSGEVHLSHSQVDLPLPFREGETFQATVWADCNSGFGVDESFTAYWVSYRVWTCDITKIEVLK